MEEELKNEATENTEAVDSAENSETVENTEKKNKSFLGKKKENAEVLKLQKQIDEMKSAYDDINDKYTRLAAEYDNYRKRTTKEIEQRYSDAKCDVWKNILTVVDDFERVLTN